MKTLGQLADEYTNKFPGLSVRSRHKKFNDYLAGLHDGMKLAAEMVITATRIPDGAIKRGTGVRDHLVVKGEQIADQILAQLSHDKKPNGTQGKHDTPPPYW